MLFELLEEMMGSSGDRMRFNVIEVVDKKRDLYDVCTKGNVSSTTLQTTTKLGSSLHLYSKKFLTINVKNGGFRLQLTGEPLIQRKDDTAETLRSRLEAFHRQTTPVCFIPVFRTISSCLCV